MSNIKQSKHFLQSMRNSNNNSSSVSIALNSNECWVTKEAATSSMRMPALKISLLIREFVHLKKLIALENKLEAKHRVLSSICRPAMAIIELFYLQKLLLELDSIKNLQNK